MRADMKHKGFLVVLSGPSGVGKNTVLNEVLPIVPDLVYSVSVTTRAARDGEVDGQSYYFVSDDEFERMRKDGELLEWAEFVGRKYGTPRGYIVEQLAQGHTVIMDIDIQGAAQIRAALPEAVSVFLMPPSFDELHRRIHGRGLDSESAIARRLSSAKAELQAVNEYDYVIVNDDVKKAAWQLQAIIAAERCRVFRTDWPRLATATEKGGAQS